MKIQFLILIVMSFSVLAHAQSGVDDFDIESEVNAVEPALPPPARPEPSQNKALPQKAEPTSSRQASLSFAEEEEQRQREVMQRKAQDEKEVSSDRNVDRFPVRKPIFTKPQGPTQGGSVRVDHPRAAEGLIRINKDGSYQYRTKVKAKSQSGAFRFGSMTPPRIETSNSQINFKNMYGTSNVYSLEGDYEWQPFRSFGALGLRLGMGVASVQANGFFSNPNRTDARTRSEESYTMYMVPVSAFIQYRFEFARRQWVVPFINGGGTYYGLAEVRNDGSQPQMAGAAAVGGGGGVLLSISRLDPAGAFTLSEEYGIADMWLIIEGRSLQGLSQDIDFTNQFVSAGIAVDF